MVKFSDTTSYHQGDKARVPREFTAKIGKISLVVHRHIDYGPETWLLTTKPGILPMTVLQSKLMATAIREAYQIFLKWYDSLSAAILEEADIELK